MGSTASWSAIEQLIRTRILTFVSVSGGADFATRIGSTASGSGSDGKLFIDQAPDSVLSSGSWAILRILDAPPNGADGRLMIKGTAELMIHARPRKAAAEVKAMATLVQEAWRGYAYTEVGGHFSAMGSVPAPGMIPYTSDPADRELVTYRLLLEFRCTPQFLLKYAA
jgi:hypothetical protein